MSIKREMRNVSAYGRKALLGILTATMLTSAVSADADSAICMRPKELHADKTRFVETQLRIATLQCRGPDQPDMRALYNEFVRANRGHFTDAEPILRRFVSRANLGSLDHYVVKLANRISLASTAVAQFCARSSIAMEMSAKLPEPANLVSLMPVKYRQPEQSCKPNTIGTPR